MIIILHSNNIRRKQVQEDWKVKVDKIFFLFLFLFLVIDHTAKHSKKVDV